MLVTALKRGALGDAPGTGKNQKINVKCVMMQAKHSKYHLGGFELVA